jgi:hypothetical protein
MDILNSEWLVYMLKKSGKTPQARLLSMFDILDDWTDAPGVNVKIKNDLKNTLLQNYLSIEAAKAGAAQPEILATQLYLMAISACNSKLESKLEMNSLPGPSDSFKHARYAADALILAQTKKEFRIAKTHAYAMAASVLFALLIAVTLIVINQEHARRLPQVALAPSAIHPVSTTSASITNPDETAALIAQIEQMRKGSCQLPEALQLPDSYKKVYFEDIVSGQISTDPADQKLVRELLQKVRCNYSPMLMANSKG